MKIFYFDEAFCDEDLNGATAVNPEDIKEEDLPNYDGLQFVHTYNGIDDFETAFNNGYIYGGWIRVWHGI